MPDEQHFFAVEVVIPGMPKTLYYSSGDKQQGLQIGSEVEVELGNRRARGWVLRTESMETALEELAANERAAAQQAANKQEAKTKSSQLGFFESESMSAPACQLKPVLSSHSVFTAEQLQLFEWMSSYYGASICEVIDNAVPKKKLQKQKLFFQLTPAAKQELVQNEFFEKLKTKAPVQADLVKILESASCPIALSELQEKIPSAYSAIKALEKKKLVEASYSPLSSNPGPKYIPPEAPQALTSAQEKALTVISKKIKQRDFAPMLLFGVTGSGKTEVYIRAIEEVLQQGGSALIIVPEIALTPQLLDQLESRLSAQLAVLHSQVGVSERWAAWEALLAGKIRVAVGARSAVFAPLENLSLIIVDEEHENSYKQSDGLRYHGRDVAVMRAKYSNCPIILGSATPSLESLHNVKQKRYKLLEMPERVTSRPLPGIEIVDLNRVKRKEMPSENISPQLHLAIAKTLESKQQAIILYNRRGFSSFLQCDSCNDVVTCPDCSVALTYHKKKDALLCHYCNTRMAAPTHCPYCRDPRTSRVELDEEGNLVESAATVETVGLLHHRGGGTEKVLVELHDLFPECSIARMDRDTVGQKGAYRNILGSMRSGETDILIGTQMIAKGHDLPGVTLVGIIDADVGLHLPDFRSAEKSYQLMTQAAGRAGRGAVQGRVLLQTRQPNHPTIVAISASRFMAFARYELEHRQHLNYPPWGRLMRLLISNTEFDTAHQSAALTAKALQMIIGSTAEHASSLSVLGPAPAPHEKLRGRYRWHVLVKSPTKRALSELACQLYYWKSEAKLPKGFRLSIDIDPVDML